MSETRGKVVSIDGDALVVELDQSGGCGRCHEPGGCGGTSIATMRCAAPKRYQLTNPGDVAVGDAVMLHLPDGLVRRGAFFGYLLPLLLLLAGAAIGMRFGGEPGSIIGGVAGLVIGAASQRVFGARGQRHREFDPVARKL